MQSILQFQLRLTVSRDLAETLRADPTCASYGALRDILHRHNATLKCQFDAFADYVREAERHGTQNYPLYQWTRETIESPEKKAKYMCSFTVYASGDEVYNKDVADAIENELSPLIGEDGIQRVFRIDTNPANNPQPPKQ